MLRRPWLGLSFLSFFLVGTVPEQRARLPPASTDCSDPVTGTWQSHRYFAHVKQWDRSSIAVTREANGSLSGIIRSDYWDGGPSDEGPVPCGPKWERQGVVQQADVTFDGTTLSVDGTSWQRDPGHACPGDAWNNYNVDHYTGEVDPVTQEFHALLNSQGDLWNDFPLVFRRTACGTPATTPMPSLDPNPRLPPEPVSRGWSCW